uniref:Interleukin 2 receptor subunit gamma n=1 Tax=Nothoprocta perdicaria TaxID=30464 RepID=A0A8C6YSA9_NOTPE
MPPAAAFLAPAILIVLLARLAAAASPTGVECVLFNEEYMTCTWGTAETLSTNYSLYYWYENRSPVAECKHYVRERGVRVGCRFAGRELVQFQPFRVRVNASVGGQSREIPSERMELQDLVKPEAPVNLTVRNLSSNELELRWSSPYPKAWCLEHAVKYKSNKDTSWTLGVKREIFSLPSVDHEKSYTFYVRSKVNSYCGSTRLWSEWSVPVAWGSDGTGKGGHRSGWLRCAPGEHWLWIHTVFIPVISSLLMLVLIVLLVRMERVWVIFMPRIPNPSKNFDELFITHKGNFQEWAGVPKDVVESFKPNYSESICHVSEVPAKEGAEPPWEGSEGPAAAPAGAPERGPQHNSYVAV